jgi:hypothetical protein
MQWRVLYDDIRESGDEGGLSCQDSVVEKDVGHEAQKPRGGIAVSGSGSTAVSIAESTSVICPPSDIKFYDESAPPRVVTMEVR